MLRHVLHPNAGITLSLLGLDLPVVVSGAIVIEVVYAWPGVGQLAASSVLGSDYPLALAICALSAGAVVLGRLGAERLKKVRGHGSRYDPDRAVPTPVDTLIAERRDRREFLERISIVDEVQVVGR